MTWQILGAFLIGLGGGGLAVLLWAFSRLGEEGRRQFDAGVREGQFLHDLNREIPQEPSELWTP